MSDKIIIRPSSTPRGLICNQSLMAPSPESIIVESESDAALMGTGLHKAFALMVQGYSVEDMLDAIFTESRAADVNDFNTLFNIGRRMWFREGGLSDYFSNSATEVPLSIDLGDGVILEGTADVVNQEDNSPRVLDWKTGRKHSDYWAQLNGYGTLLGRCERDVWACIAWVSEYQFDARVITVADQKEYADSVVKMVHNPNPAYVTGDHCGYCPRRRECPGIQTEVRSAALMLADFDENLEVAPRELLASAYYRVKMIEKMVEQFNRVVRIDIDNNGPLILPDGSHLGFSESERTKVSAKNGWQVLNDRFDEDELDSFVTIGTTRMKEIVRGRADGIRGAKKRAEDELMTALVDAGALHKKTIKTLRVTSSDKLLQS